MQNYSTIFKEQLTNISSVLNNTGNTTQLLTSFSSLDIAQQKVLLSSKLLTEEQKAQCATMMALSSANTKYTAEQLIRSTGISSETLATWGLTQATDTLTASQLAELASSDAQAKTVLEKIVIQNAQAVANGKITASNATLAASETNATLATGSFTTAIKANIAAMWTWMTTTPLGWLTLLAAGIFTAVKLYDLFTVSVEEANEKIDESRSAYEETTSAIESMNSELETTNQRIKELESKGSLSFTDKEELDNLKEQNNELERSISLLEKKQKNEATQTVVDIKQNKDTLDEDFDESLNNLSLFKKEYEETRKIGIKGISEGTVALENYEATMASYDKIMGQYEASVLEKIEKYEQYKDDIINKYGTDDISLFSNSDRNLYNSIVSQLQNAYKLIYSDSEYNKFVIEPIFDSDKLKGLQDEILKYFISGGQTDLSSLEEKFGSDIITALRSACEKAGIDFDKMIEDMYNNSQSKLNQIAPLVDKPSGVYDAKQNQISKQIRDYIQNDLSDEDRTILLNATIPDDVKFKTKQDVDNFIASLHEEVNENGILSFSDAWKSAESETREALLELAKAGELAPETLESTEEYNKLLTQTGLTAEQVANKINKMVDSSDQLASMGSGIKSLSENLGTKKENPKQAIGYDTLAGMSDELKECTAEWKEYERVMGDASSTYDQCKKATNELATAFVNSNNFLANLTSKTEGQYISQLKLMGVENAEEVVKNTLNNKIEAQNNLEDAAKEKKISLANATWKEIASTEVYDNALGNARVAMQALFLQQNILSNSSLDMSQKIDALENFITKIDEANSKIILLEANDVFNSSMSKYLKKTNGTDMSGANKYAQKQKEKYLAKQAKSLSKVKIKDNVSVTPPKSSSTKSTGAPSSSSSSSSSSKESKEEIDWIDRRLTSINNKLSLIKATYDNIADTVKNNDLFKIVDKQNSNLQKQEKYLQKLYNTAIRGADKYAKKANSIKLSSKLKNLVKSEAELGKKTSYKSLIKKYGQKTADKIAKYRDYYDKSLSLKQSAQDYKQQKTQAKIQRYQNRVDLYQDVIDKHDAQKENNTTAKEKEKHIKKQIEYTKKLYAHQIEIAKLEGNNQEVEKLKAEQIKKELDYRKEIQQNYADEAEARYNLNKQYESNAITAKEKNKYEAESLKDLKEQYSKLISIAKLDGDITEQKRLQAEYAEKELESRKQIFDNIQQEYDRKSNFLSQRNNAISNELAIAQARGEIIGEGYYTSQMVNTKSDLDLKKAERIELLNSLADIEFGTDKWYEAQEQLNSIDEGIQNDTKSLAEFQSAINDLKFDRFNELINKVDDVANETNFLTDMLDSDNFFDSDTGMISEDGITAMGLAAQNYDVYIAKAQEYDKAIEELNEMYANGEIGIESYNSKMRELRQEQQDAIKSWNDSKKAVIQYVRDGLNAQNEALQKAIDLKKKLLEEEKDLKEWQDKVANSNKNIAKIQKQINALEGDDSEENRKKLQTLKSELQDAQKSHDDMLYDRSIEDQEKDLDDMLDKSKKQAEEYLKDTDKVFTDALNYINKHTEQVSHNLEKISKDIGFDISNYIGNAWKTSGNAVGEYKDILTSNIPGITSQIGIIRDSWLAVCNAASQAAEASARASQKPVIETQNTGNNVSTQDASKNQTSETSKNIAAEIIDNVVNGSKQPDASSAVTDLINTLPTSNTNSNLTATLSNSGLTGSLSSNSSKILPSNSSKEKKVVDFIKANASKARKKRSKYAALNQYIYDKTGGKILSTKEEVNLAKLLGVSVKSDLSGKNDRDNILKALKKLTANSKFANGGILGDLVKVSGEDGLFIGSKGESVLTKEQTQAMLKLAPMIPQMNSILGVINKPISNLGASSPHIEINTTIEGVATDQIVKDFEHVATQQAENVVKRINNATYTKGVRRR